MSTCSQLFYAIRLLTKESHIFTNKDANLWMKEECSFTTVNLYSSVAMYSWASVYCHSHNFCLFVQNKTNKKKSLACQSGLYVSTWQIFITTAISNWMMVPLNSLLIIQAGSGQHFFFFLKNIPVLHELLWHNFYNFFFFVILRSKVTTRVAVFLAHTIWWAGGHIYCVASNLEWVLRYPLFIVCFKHTSQ